MELERGRPVITIDDYPDAVAKSLRGIVGKWTMVNPRIDSSEMYHRTLNAYETVEDVFPTIDGEDWLAAERRATLWDLSPELLEEAIVAYGLALLETDGIDESELRKVDYLLNEINALKNNT